MDSRRLFLALLVRPGTATTAYLAVIANYITIIKRFVGSTGLATSACCGAGGLVISGSRREARERIGASSTKDAGK